MNKSTLSTVALLVSSLSLSSFAGSVEINSFEDLAGAYTSSRGVQMDSGENLMVDDGTTVESVGLDGSDWYMGFLDFDPSGAAIVGWAHNDLNFLMGMEGRMIGNYTNFLASDADQTPDEVWLVHDVDDDGVIGVLDAGVFTVDAEDDFYTAADIRFGPGQVLGDVSQLPSYNQSGSLIFPDMVLVLEFLLPGDVNGDGFVGAEDLDVVMANWGDSVGTISAGDLSGDGFVGPADLDLVLGAWGNGTPTNPAIPEPGTLGILGLGCLIALRRRR